MIKGGDCIKDNLVNRIGSSLKDLRKHQKISQKKLAENICAQSYISMIEKGEISPAAHILYSISLKLGVDISYFFDAYDNNMYSNMTEFVFQVRNATERNNFEEVKSLLNSQRENPYFKTDKMTNFFKYHFALCNYYLNNDKEGALKRLQETLTQSSQNSEVFLQEDFNALLSIAVIYTQEKEWVDASFYYNQVENLFKKRPRLTEPRQGIRFYYNYCRYLYSVKKYSEVSLNANKGIRLCVELKTYYLHGELYYYKGLSCFKEKHEQDGIEALKNAKLIFTFSDQQNHKKLVEQVLFEHI
ncbi:helix-turn-helix transcriptional regulator [Bacillus sp. BHET2]|nr:helix-turn-helix transcriptional regulator [Bacillus sp. BHET2]